MFAACYLCIHLNRYLWALNKLGHFYLQKPTYPTHISSRKQRRSVLPHLARSPGVHPGRRRSWAKASAQGFTSLSPHPTSISRSSSFVFRHTLTLRSGGSDGYWQRQALMISVAITMERDHLSPTGLAVCKLALLGLTWHRFLLGEPPFSLVRAGWQAGQDLRSVYVNLMHWTRESGFLQNRTGGMLPQEGRTSAAHDQQKHYASSTWEYSYSSSLVQVSVFSV